MSLMRLIILAVAAAAAVAAAMLVRNLEQAPESTAEPVERIVEVEVSQTKVLVSLNDVRVGTLLTPDDFAWVDWPEASLNIGYFTQETTPDAMETLAGSVAKMAMYAEEPILPQKIVQKGETGFMAALLQPGYRAATIEISPELASAGFILPFDRVDVLLTADVEMPGSETGETEDRTVTMTIMENVRILAIDQQFGSLDGVPVLTGSTATMELTPEQAELLAQTSNTGQISLTLRSYADADFNDGNAVAKLDLLNGMNARNGVVTIYRSGKPSVGGS